MIKLKPVSEQVIVITGASSGIGLATARAAVAAGAKIVISARNGEELDRIRAELEATGGEVEAVAVDIADDDGAARISAAAIARFGGFDTWVNNAAAATVGRITATSVDDHRRVFDVGYFGLVRGSLAAVEHLRGKGGTLINIGSIESDRGVLLQGPYSAMKHAVKGFTDVLRTEVEADGFGISVTLVKPAAIHTPFPEHARNLTGHPVTLPPVIYAPELVAKAVIFAAAHPRRDLSVGGTGVLMTRLAQHFPRATDFAVERFGEALQTFDKAAPPERADNLHEPRADGDTDSRQNTHVRRQSLWLEAQMRPVATLALAGLAVVGTIAARRR